MTNDAGGGDTNPAGPASAGAADPHEEASTEDVQRALRQVSKSDRPPPAPIATSHKIRIGTYVLMFLAASALFYAVQFNLFAVTATYVALVQRLARGAMFATLVLLAGSIVQAYVVSRLDDDASRYNVGRVVRLVQAVLIGFIAMSVIFVNWYTAAVSLGIVTAILGFALQTPISSFIGWGYIIVKRPYGVGDRIQIGAATGDVIDINYLDTTLWEFGGPYLSTDQPSGRLIKFPNANVLSEPVYNYSWPLFPYIWNEVRFQIAYESDLQFVATTMREVAEAEIGKRMQERVTTYRELLARTAVDELEVSARPVVLFQFSENMWIEAVVRYLVSPRRAATIKSDLTAKILGAFNASPDKVMFPQGDAR